tara:strand:+ start:225 stop:398 length:174 start_codon:yes stop_codon:yes gene_type:complete
LERAGIPDSSLQANKTRRDHNPETFICFLAGARVRKGSSYGESDEFAFKAAGRKEAR